MAGLFFTFIPMLTFFNKYGKNYTYSQNLEEGIIEEVLKRLKIETGHCVDIGANNGSWCSNVALLIDKGWSAMMVEADFDLWTACCAKWHGNKLIKSQCSEVTPDNVNAFVDDRCVVLNIDVDGTDLSIFKAVEARPTIVILEVNSGFPPDQEHDSPQQGCSYLTAAKAAVDKGYFVLCHTGNVILVDKKHRKLFPEIKGNGIDNAELYFRRDWLKPVGV